MEQQATRTPGRKPTRCLTCGPQKCWDGDNAQGYTCRNCSRWHSATTSKAALLAILRRHSAKPTDSTLDVVRRMDNQIAALRYALTNLADAVETRKPEHEGYLQMCAQKAREACA